jgi:hypothetical protein
MKRMTLIFALVSGLIFCACGQASNNPLADVRAVVVNSLGENLSLVHAGDPVTVTKDSVVVGSAPNQVLIFGSEILVLSSTSNSLEVIDPETWTVVRQYSLGDGCSPYMMAETSNSLLLVTCFASNQLLKVDPQVEMTENPIVAALDMPTGSDLLPYDVQAPGHARPQGVVVVGNTAYLTLSNLGDDWMPAGPGLVVVVDIASWTKDKIIELSKTNPATIYRPVLGGNKLYVPCSGAFDGTGVVEVMDSSSGTIVSTIEIGGAPGRMFIDADGTAWVGDQLDGQVLRFNVSSGQVGDAIMLCPSDYNNGIYDYISDVATDGKGTVFASCFATDQICMFSASGDGSDAVCLEVGDGPVALLVPQK